MTVWTVTAAVLLGAMVFPLALLGRGAVMDGLVALQLVGVLAVLVLLVLAEADADSSLADPAVVLAALTAGSGLVFARHLERRT
jgi:multisubunit Na+/H+ antiporter MnhF subunit